MQGVKKLRGRCWVFGDLMDVDWEIVPVDIVRQLRNRFNSKTLSQEEYEAELGKLCMTNADPEFPKKVKKGDFIVGGQGFGYGHDPELSSVSIRAAGVAAVICESSNTNFIRNSIHHALPVIVCKGIKKKVTAGDELEIDLVAGTITNLSTGEKLRFEPLPDFLLNIIEADGLYPFLAKQVKAGKR